MIDTLIMLFKDLTWTGLGQIIALIFAGLAVIIGVTGYLSDVLHVRRRKQVVAEAREMVRLIKAEKEKKSA